MEKNLESLKRQLQIHRKNLDYLKEQAAHFGSIGIPLSLRNQIEAEQETIDSIAEQLATLPIQSPSNQHKNITNSPSSSTSSSIEDLPSDMELLLKKFTNIQVKVPYFPRLKLSFLIIAFILLGTVVFLWRSIYSVKLLGTDAQTISANATPISTKSNADSIRPTTDSSIEITSTNAIQGTTKVTSTTLIDQKNVDFLVNADTAYWTSGSGVKLDFNSKESGSNGVAEYRNYSTLEDGLKHEKALLTHPNWQDKGRIAGELEVDRILKGEHFIGKVAFAYDSLGQSNGVRIIIYFRGDIIFNEVRVPDGSIKSINVDMSQYADGYPGKLILEIQANGDATHDSLLWLEARIDKP